MDCWGRWPFLGASMLARRWPVQRGPPSCGGYAQWASRWLYLAPPPIEAIPRVGGAGGRGDCALWGNRDLPDHP